MLSINWSDVWKMVESIKVPLIVIGVALTLALIVSLAVFKMGKPARKLTRSTAWVAAFVAIVVAVVSMMYGGFKTVLDLAAGTGALTDASKAQVEELGNDISDEGMVLLKNNNGALPLAKGSAINVWGWGSTNPIYGGTGSGGFDCSGFTMHVFSNFGVSLAHGATPQLNNGYTVSQSELQPGDLVFFFGTYNTSSAASHVGIYIGGGQFIHASTSRGVIISSLSESYYASRYLTARRVF